MRMVDLIRQKRDGGTLSEAEIRFMIDGFTAGEIPDYQMSAMAMAILFRGMTRQETGALTEAMWHSGDCIDLSRFGSLSVDKHSTGGVGDKTTLIVGPIVAALGGKVAKMSGRGLGHTGGTVDKLEAIPGFQTTLSPQQMLRQVEAVGIAVTGQSGNLTPADKKLYALRDVTATVDSLPLIAASVLSKKLAAGAQNIVLDVKVGSGAFMKTQEAAALLATEMVEIGKAQGRNVSAVLSNMDIPLGNCIGNALEVMEAAEILQGRGCPDLRELCLVLSTEMLHLCRGLSLEESRQQAEQCLQSGKAFAAMEEWVAAQGGDAAALSDFSRLPQPSITERLTAQQSGYIVKMDAQVVGEASVMLGAGRARKEDPIDYAAGIRLLKKTGDYAVAGEPIAVLYTSQNCLLEEAMQTLHRAYTWGDAAPRQEALIFDVVR